MSKENMLKAATAARAAADEANTIATYLEMLAGIDDGEYKEEISVEYREIIGDEFNHIVRFTELASVLCGIEIPED